PVPLPPRILGDVRPATRGYRDARAVAASGRALTSHAAVGPSSPQRPPTGVPFSALHVRCGPFGVPARRSAGLPEVSAHRRGGAGGHPPGGRPEPPEERTEDRVQAEIERPGGQPLPEESSTIPAARQA